MRYDIDTCWVCGLPRAEQRYDERVCQCTLASIASAVHTYARCPESDERIDLFLAGYRDGMYRQWLLSREKGE